MDTKPFTKEERKFIGRLAKESIKERLMHWNASPQGIIDKLFKEEIERFPILKEQAACFVELEKNCTLRGCIGSMVPHRPLYGDVVANAMSAAFKDPRFPPVMDWEIEEISIEVSVLGDFDDTKKIEDIEIGVHGVSLERSGRKAVLLPKIATRYDMTLEDFLDAACIRAGIVQGGWDEPDTKLILFKIKDTIVV